jgi:hypothetical protein
VLAFWLLTIRCSSSDPTESHNLAKVEIDKVLELYTDLVALLQGSEGTITAGDAEDSSITPEIVCAGPWLADGVRPMDLDAVETRFFVALAGKVWKLVVVVSIAVVGSAAAICFYSGCCSARGGSRRKRKAQ